MDWKQHFKIRNPRFWNACIIFLMIAVNLLILYGVSSSKRPGSEAACGAVCNSHQRWIYRIMSEVPDGEVFELPPEWTVADLIQEAVRKDRLSPHPLPEEAFICRNIRYIREFFRLRRMRAEVYAPYFVFPAPASVVFDGSNRPPVPLLMCPPGAHGKHGSCVLYSDGTTRFLTAEEAEILVAERSPTPIMLEKSQSESSSDQDGVVPRIVMSDDAAVKLQHIDKKYFDGKVTEK